MVREDVYKALYEKICNGLGDKVVTTGRKLRHWDDVDSGEQPAVFMAQTGETNRSGSGLQRVWEFGVDIYVYTHAGEGSDTLPATQMNEINDLIMAAIKPNAVNSHQTLDDLVLDVQLSGAIETDEGLLGPQSISIIPLKITVNE